ncbi:hypothetical protein EAE96_001023 [Botrytis aclada]|nr:hypothetical protein EAE96_001023 [Botrytis aclada]
MSEDLIFPTNHPAHAVFHKNRESMNGLLSVMGYETLMLKNNRSSRIKAWSMDVIIDFTREVLLLNPQRSGTIGGHSPWLGADVSKMLLALKQTMKQEQLRKITTGYIHQVVAGAYGRSVLSFTCISRVGTLILLLEKGSNGGKKEIILSKTNWHSSLYGSFVDNVIVSTSNCQKCYLSYSKTELHKLELSRAGNVS